MNGVNAGKVGANLRRFIPLLILAIGLALFFAFDLDHYLSFASLREHRHLLLSWVAAHPLLAPLAYMLAYIVVVAFSLPGGAVMTITGGFLFGTVFGAFYAVVGATIGATVLFLAARTALAEPLKAKAGPRLARMRKGFQQNAFHYLLVLRLIPIFPFWLVNLAPALLGVPLSTYVAATFIGIIPGGLVYVLVGSGLGSVFDRGEDFSLQSVMTPQIIAALVGLALLALLPVAYKKFKGKTPVEEA